MTKTRDILNCLSSRILFGALFALFASAGCDNESEMIREARVKSSGKFLDHNLTPGNIPVIDTTRPGTTVDWYIVNTPDEWKDVARYMLWCNFEPVGLTQIGTNRGTARIPWGKTHKPALIHNQIEFGLSVFVDDEHYHFYSKSVYYLRDTVESVTVYLTPNQKQKVCFEPRPKSVIVH